MGASGQTNWRINQGFMDWTMDMEKRLMHEERRKPPPEAGHTFVQGIGAWTERVYDWDDPVPQSNGYWHSEPGAINSPDGSNSRYWIGQTYADGSGFGVQTVTEYRPPDDVDGNPVENMAWPAPTYSRRFYSIESSVDTLFSPWVQTGGPGPYSSRYKVSPVTVNPSEWTPVEFNVVSSEYGGIGLSWEDGQYLVSQPGLYQINSTVTFDANPDGRRDMRHMRNGNALNFARVLPHPTQPTVVNLTTFFQQGNSTSEVWVEVQQTTTAGLQVLPGIEFSKVQMMYSGSFPL